MITLSNEQIAEIKRLHQENIDNLNAVIDGHEDLNEPHEITNPQASCLISHAIANQIEILHIINQSELNIDND